MLSTFCVVNNDLLNEWMNSFRPGGWVCLLIKSNTGIFTHRSNVMYKITKIRKDSNAKGLEDCTQGVWRPAETEKDKLHSHWEHKLECLWQVQNLLWRQRKSEESFGERGNMIKNFKRWMKHRLGLGQEETSTRKNFSKYEWDRKSYALRIFLKSKKDLKSFWTVRE